MNTSPRKLFQNYRELVTEKAAKEYFAVVPKKKKSGGATKESNGKKASTKKLVPGGLATRAKGIKKLPPAE